MKINKAIQKARKSRGMTLAELGEKLGEGGISRQAVHEYEKGLKDPGCERLKELAAALDLKWEITKKGVEYTLNEK